MRRSRKNLEDEVQHVFLGRRLRVWQKMPPERHAFLSATITSPMLGYFMFGPLLLRQKSRSHRKNLFLRFAASQTKNVPETG
jgi:hypothetical protein